MKKTTMMRVWVLVLSLYPLLAHSATLSFRASGVVTSTDANTVAISEVQIGDSVTAVFIYDTDSIDELASEPAAGRYASETLRIEIADDVYEAKDNTVAITNNAVLIPDTPVMDSFEIVSPLRDVSGPDLSGLPIAQIDIVLVDTTAEAFDDDTLPPTLSVDDFDITSEEPYGTTGGRLIFQSLSAGQTGEVRFRITSIDVMTVVPSGQDGGYFLTSELWSKAVLQVPGNPVTLVWQEVGSDTTPGGDRVVSGYFYADPDDFAYGSPYNPEVFVKVYIASNGWANIAFNHVTVDDVAISSAHRYNGSVDKSGTATLETRLIEHQYDGVGQQ